MEADTDPEADPGPQRGRERGADRRMLYVPVHTCAGGTVSIRTGRLPSGQAVGLGFTSPARLAMVFGEWHPWIQLHLGALHAMLEPLGVTLVRIDPLRPPARREPAVRRGPGHGTAPRAGLPAPDAPAAARTRSRAATLAHA
ncbi:MAG TPA: SAV_915 family protein [Streptosporangiaceae bacterium]